MELILHTFGNTAPSRIQPKQDANVYKWPLTALRKLAKKVVKFFFKWKKAAMKTEKMQPPNIEKNLS